MLRENDIKVVRKIFEQHHYVMSTAEILKAKLYYQLSTMLAAFCSRRILEVMRCFCVLFHHFCFSLRKISEK